MNPIKFIEKHPLIAAAILPVLLVLYVSYPGSHKPPTQSQEQIQNQAQVGEPLDDLEDEPFDRTQCKVYYAGVVLGANVFRFRYSSSNIYLMFTDSDRLVDKHQNRGIGIWQTKADFLNVLGYDLMQQMEPEVKEVFASRLDSASYVAVVDDSLTTKAIGSANSCVR
ncbi:hypothetical protein H6G94_03920 [Nostoc punctiforme FACHB-252]|uniref:Uncharacterized protein n=1 Tax=Nostoc punctiforme FACHB-252 TaxID=1357509 RepID=A0ABR8H3Z0_NOSPU|nr:hypothetical protein [Nostoc punctiforme]MBD2610428.1 hypothetical protein [Nostoc punctiforme FACHB-252]